MIDLHSWKVWNHVEIFQCSNFFETPEVDIIGIFHILEIVAKQITGRERLIRRRLIRSST